MAEKKFRAPVKRKAARLYAYSCDRGHDLVEWTDASDTCWFCGGVGDRRVRTSWYNPEVVTFVDDEDD